jgi:hypothetical protein
MGESTSPIIRLPPAHLPDRRKRVFMPTFNTWKISSVLFHKQLLTALLLLSLAIISTIDSGWWRPSSPYSSITPSQLMPEEVKVSPTLNKLEDGVVPNGLTASDWVGIRGEYERHRHAAFAVASEHRARNYRQQWLSHFDGRGFTVAPNEANWSWGLELKSYGFAGSERIVKGKAEVKTAVERVTYMWNDELDEWFVNDRRGLEHGFTLKQRPERGSDNSSPLQLRLAVRGGLRARVQPGGQAVSFVDGEASAVNYSGLKVWDADGKEVAAHFSGEGEEVRLTVDETAARYPLTIDPIAQQAYLKASNTGAGDFFGVSVAISGETIVVGAPIESSNATGVNGNQSDESALHAGAAYVFVRNGSTWSQQAYLKASNTGAGDNFGTSAAISGQTVVVGADLEDSNATGVNGDGSDNSVSDSGAAYIFTGLGNSAPAITAESGITRQAGSPSANSTIATVNDLDSGAGSVTVTVDGGASSTVNGVTVSDLVNNNGTVTADVIAACGATNASFTLSATDGTNTAQTTLNVTVTANTAPGVSYPSLPSVVIGNSTMVSPATATDNGSIASYSIVNVIPPLNTAPTVDATGVVSITSAAHSGNHTITVRATDNCGLSSTTSFSLNVICSLTLPTSVPAGMAGTAYSVSVAANVNVGLSYSLIGGSLAPGLSLNPTTGIISGTPNVVGSYNFVIKAQAGDCSAAQSYTLVINCPIITVNPGTLSAGTVGSSYSASFSAAPAGNYQFSVSAGALPPGLSLNTTTGVLSGTPTTANTYTFTITARGFGNCTGSQSYTLTINPAPCPTSITLPALPNGKVGQYYFGSVSASPSGSYDYIVSGNLPPGISLIGSAGFLYGNPMTPGEYTFTITATRSGGGGCIGSRTYTVLIAGI